MSGKIISTLFELLDEYKVEVPIVQRDYAQGRQDDHARNVRFNLLKDMRAAILGETQPLDLSFVYGKAEDKKFIPIDGQQRLTTLFLLYLYAFRNDETKTSLLHCFTYETRITSREFLIELIKNRAIVFAAETKPSLEIEDSEWFVLSWAHDPTIMSVIVMLDDIVKYFNNIINLADRLTDKEDEPIVFKFLEMQDLGMEDSLYIKLNARGKALTEFENFKAQLIGRMKNLKLPFIDAFKINFDGEWTDLFWRNHKKDFDQTYYAFFGVLLMNRGVIQDDKNWANVIDYSNIDVDIFEIAFYTLEFLCRNPGDEEATLLVFNALSDKRTYSNRVLFHALTTYLLKAKGEDKGTLKQWLRIIRNLVFNSTIDKMDLYRSAIDSINSFSGHWNKLILFFADKNRVGGFNQQQIEEEQIKAKIIMDNESFASKIRQAEQHPYFSGQIRSALYLAKNTEVYNEGQFIYYWERIAMLFDATKPKYGNILRRALLTFGDYTLEVSKFKTLCVDDPNEAANTPGLKSLFANCGTITKQLISVLDLNQDIKLQLVDIIKKSTVNSCDWRYCFIYYPQLFEWMSISHLRLRVLNGEMHMIQNKQANGYNYELFLSALYEELKTRGKKSLFDSELGGTVQHCLYIKEYRIIFHKRKFCVQDKTNKTIFQSQSTDPIAGTADFISMIV